MHITRTLSVLALIALPLFSHAGQGDFSAGLKFGMMDIDGGDSETALGVQLGYRATPRVAAEVEILQAEFGNVDVDSFAVYGTYRSQGDMYFLGKIGIASLDGGGDDETGLSFGLGGGMALGNNVSIEAEYTVLDSDVTFFGLTGKLTFN